MSKSTVAIVPETLRKQDSLACAHCGAVQWSRRSAPLKAVYDLLARRGALTTRQVAEALKVNINNASEKLARLEKMGLVEITDHSSYATGGRVNTYALVSHGG